MVIVLKLVVMVIVLFLIFSDMLEFRLDKEIFINYNENVLKFYEDLGYLFDKEQLLVRKR